MNAIMQEDYKRIGNESFLDWDTFAGKTFLITGGTGLIGLNLINCLLYNNREKGLGIKIYIPVRNTKAAYDLFGDDGSACIIPYCLGETLEIDDEIDYMVHLASPTSSRFFTEKPVDTMVANIEGTKAILELANAKHIKKLVILSTMEVYGFPEKGHTVKENELGSLDTMNTRNSYPIAKIACEALCHSFYRQFDVPAVILRLTQTLGPGVRYDDNRVFAQFMRCSIEKKNIVLKSLGLTERSYLYTGDAVSAILVALLRAKAGEAYTVANPDTYCSIAEMAAMVANKITNGEIEVVFDIAEDITKLGYAETLYMDLDISKLKSLGWRPETDLYTAFIRMIACVNSSEELPI